MKATRWMLWAVSALVAAGCTDGRDAEVTGQPVGQHHRAVTGGDSVVTGTKHTCAVLGTGEVRCWGEGISGKLGYGNTTTIGDNETPVSAGNVDVGGSVVQVAASLDHTCALLDTGAVRCWGKGSALLGYGNTTTIGDDETPASAGDIDLGGSAVQIAAGYVHTCALLDTGAVRCWGSASYGKLGYGNSTTIGDNETPASAGDVPVGGTAMQITAGPEHTCALLDTGAVRCWGLNNYGQLGYGNTNNIGDNETPASAGDVPLGGTAVHVDAGVYHTCALLDTGAVRCWGQGSSGQLGYGNTNNIGDNETPASAGDVPLGSPVTQITANESFTCALYSTGDVRCWGTSYVGQLGYGNRTSIGDNELPTAVGYVPVGAPVLELSVGHGFHTCAMTSTTAMTCWGGNGYGQLGLAHTINIGDNEHASSGSNVQYR